MRFDAGPMLRAAVVGYGNFGRRHAEKYLARSDTRLVAVCDRDPRRRSIARAALPGVSILDDPRDLVGHADIASIVVPASAHHAVARQLLDGGLHLLVEKPFTAALAEARSLAARAHSLGLVLQPGYLERFNRALADLRERLPSPAYVEARRLTHWRRRGADVNVVLDLMIHDIDTLLALVTAPLTRIEARGARVFSTQWDVANARLHFADGCVASLTASRASPFVERRLHVFAESVCALTDTLAGVTVLHRLDAANGLTAERLAYANDDPLAAEVDAFVRAVQQHRQPAPDASTACRALDVAERIVAVMEQDEAVVARAAQPMTAARARAWLMRRHG